VEDGVDRVPGEAEGLGIVGERRRVGWELEDAVEVLGAVAHPEQVAGLPQPPVGEPVARRQDRGQLRGGDDAGAVVGELKALQENLGTFQDCHVQETELRALGSELVAAGAGAGTLMAMGVLVDDVRRRAAAARAEFADRFSTFDRPAARRRVAHLLGTS
jgi:hypothetical protein